MQPWEAYLFEYETYLGDAVKHWRDKQDHHAARQKVNVGRIYKQGNFLDLPKQVLMAVCYVDAYQCALEALHQYRKAWLKKERERLQAEREYRRLRNRIKRFSKWIAAWFARPMRSTI